MFVQEPQQGTEGPGHYSCVDVAALGLAGSQLPPGRQSALQTGDEVMSLHQGAFFPTVCK